MIIVHYNYQLQIKVLVKFDIIWTVDCLGTEGKEGEDNTDTVPAVGGPDDTLDTGEDLLRGGEALAAVPGSSNLSDALRCDVEGAISSFHLLHGHGGGGTGQED